MGIQGLIDQVEGTQVSLAQLQGRSFAIDGHCLLHRTAYRFAENFVLKGETRQISSAVAKIVEKILGVSKHTILIFDGDNLPSKAGTNKLRQQARDEAKQKAIRMRNNGDLREYQKYLQQAIGFQKEQVEKIANEIIEQLQRYPNFYCFMAPYEADAQLIKLQREGLADVIVTLDSDLLLYGPQKVLFKFDSYTNSGYLVTFDGIFQKLFVNSNEIVLRKAAILSGCDYVKNLKGVGLIVAQKTVAQQ